MNIQVLSMKKSLDCVYDKKIASPCPARVLLGQFSKPKKLEQQINKYIQPNNPAFREAQQFMQQYMKLFENLLDQELSRLTSFCHSCPFREVYVAIVKADPARVKVLE